MNRYLIVDYIENVLYSMNDVIINDDDFSSSVSCIDKLDLHKEMINTLSDDIKFNFDDDKIKYFIALYNLKKAFNIINDFTLDATMGDFNKILNNKNYPFDKDFNELNEDINKWVNDNLDRLEI